MTQKEELSAALIETYWVQFIQYREFAQGNSKDEIGMGSIVEGGISLLPTLSNKAHVALQMHLFDIPASHIKEDCPEVDELFRSLTEEEKKGLEIHANPRSHEHVVHILNELVKTYNKRLETQKA